MKKDNISDFVSIFFKGDNPAIDKSVALDYLVYGEKFGNPTYEQFMDLWINKNLKYSKDNYDLLISCIDKTLLLNRGLDDYLIDLRGKVMVHTLFTKDNNCTLVVNNNSYHFDIFDDIKIDGDDYSIKPISISYELDGSTIKKLDAIYDASNYQSDPVQVYRHMIVDNIDQDEAIVYIEEMDKESFSKGLNNWSNNSKRLVKSKK